MIKESSNMTNKLVFHFSPHDDMLEARTTLAMFGISESGPFTSKFNIHYYNAIDGSLTYMEANSIENAIQISNDTYNQLIRCFTEEELSNLNKIHKDKIMKVDK